MNGHGIIFWNPGSMNRVLRGNSRADEGSIYSRTDIRRDRLNKRRQLDTHTCDLAIFQYRSAGHLPRNENQAFTVSVRSSVGTRSTVTYLIRGIDNRYRRFTELGSHSNQTCKFLLDLRWVFGICKRENGAVYCS